MSSMTLGARDQRFLCEGPRPGALFSETLFGYVVPPNGVDD